MGEYKIARKAGGYMLRRIMTGTQNSYLEIFVLQFCLCTFTSGSNCFRIVSIKRPGRFSMIPTITFPPNSQAQEKRKHSNDTHKIQQKGLTAAAHHHQPQQQVKQLQKAST